MRSGAGMHSGSKRDCRNGSQEVDADSAKREDVMLVVRTSGAQEAWKTWKDRELGTPHKPL